MSALPFRINSYLRLRRPFASLSCFSCSAFVFVVSESIHFCRCRLCVDTRRSESDGGFSVMSFSKLPQYENIRPLSSQLLNSDHLSVREASLQGLMEFPAFDLLSSPSWALVSEAVGSALSDDHERIPDFLPLPVAPPIPAEAQGSPHDNESTGESKAVLRPSSSSSILLATSMQRTPSPTAFQHALNLHQMAGVALKFHFDLFAAAVPSKVRVSITVFPDSSF